MFPIGMFIYAWSAVPQIPWIALIIGMTVYLSIFCSLKYEFTHKVQIFMWATFTLYLVAFTYLSDW